jgi:RNase adaptor protein for sRNA GlmZ degradation
MNTVEYFENRKAAIEEQLAALNSGRVLRVLQETANGTIDVTELEKERLRQTIHDYWRAAENLRRINSSQRNS